MRELPLRIAIMAAALLVAAVGIGAATVFLCLALYSLLLTMLSAPLAALAAAAFVFVLSLLVIGESQLGIDTVELIPVEIAKKTKALGLSENEPDSVRAAAAEFILEGLHAHRRISRNEERGFAADDKPKPREPRDRDREREEKEGRGERPNFRRGYN